ncbi:hypothetical protein TRVL_05813 [Trypanosoma vivax]|nr:hypothetical protein TRVL_05813 [Trypanosoma vivax]
MRRGEWKRDPFGRAETLKIGFWRPCVAREVVKHVFFGPLFMERTLSSRRRNARVWTKAVKWKYSVPGSNFSFSRVHLASAALAARPCVEAWQAALFRARRSGSETATRLPIYFRCCPYLRLSIAFHEVYL